MKRKLLVLLSLLFVATITAFGAVGCSEKPDPVLKLNKTSLILEVNASETLTATFENAEESPITWTSSDESVAVVADGVVTAHKAGTATVTATAGDLSAACTVTVNAPVIPHPVLKLNKTELVLELYASETLTATFENAEESAITWKSSDDSVVKVADGVVTAYKAGTSTVTATAGDLSAACTVTVNTSETTPEFSNLPETLSVIKGASETLDLTLEYNGADFTLATVDIKTDGDKISISDDNEVLGLAYGEQTITVTAKVGENVVATATVKVTVDEYGQLIVDLPENKLHLILGQDTYDLSKIKAVLNVGQVENPELTAVPADEKVATVQDGKICPVGAGETTVTVSFEGELDTYETTIYVTVEKEVINKDVNFYAKGSGAETSAELGSATIDLKDTGIDLSTVTAVLCNDENVDFDVSDTKITLTDMPGGYQYYTLVTPVADYVIDGVVYGKEIATADELLEWRKNAETCLTYVVLKNDIDLKGIALPSLNSQPHGTLDGLGHTISNFTYSATNGFVHYNYGTLRNLQFVNAVQDCTGSETAVQVGLLGNNNMGTIENILAKIVIKNLSGEVEHYGALCFYLSNNSELRNAVVYITAEGSVPKYVYGIYCSNEGTGTAVNANVVSNVVTGQAAGSGATDCNFYASEAAMLDAVDFTAWGGYWQTAGSKAYMTDYSAAEKNVAVTSHGEATIGSTISFDYTSFYPLTIALEKEVTGVSVSNNKVVIGAEAAVGSEFTVVISSEQYPDWSKTFTFKVERKVTQLEGNFLAKGSNTDKWSYDTGEASFDLTGKGVDLSQVTAVEADGESFTDYTINGNVLTLTNAPAGDCVYTLKTATEDFRFTGCIYNNGISTVTELESWRTTESYWYTVLLNDIDYDGAPLTKAGANVLGKLDGRGHSISNFTFTDGFVKSLYAADSVIKNVAFLNVTQDCTGITDYGLFGQSCAGTIENVYVQITAINLTKDHNGLLAYGLQSGAVAKNVVLDIQSENAYGYYAFNQDYGGTTEGIVGSYGSTSGASEIASAGWDVAGTGFYSSLAAMISAEEYDELLTFTSPFWVIDTAAGTIALQPLNTEA